MPLLFGSFTSEGLGLLDKNIWQLIFGNTALFKEYEVSSTNLDLLHWLITGYGRASDICCCYDKRLGRLIVG